MLALRRANTADGSALSTLIFSSAPVLLPYLFGSKRQALDYIIQASQLDDGQYSAQRHQAVYEGNKLIACITLWDVELPESFHLHTLQSIKDFLEPNQIIHLISTNQSVREVFLAPTKDQLCIGHLAILEEYRGVGVGKKLIAYAALQAKLRKKNQLVLDVDDANKEAITFYLGLGFIIMQSYEYVYTSQTFHRMQYSLG